MALNKIKYANSGTYLLGISLIMTSYILFAQLDVYKYILSGLIFELLWLPVMLGLIIVPIICIIIFIKKGFRLVSFEFAAMLISLINILLIFTLHSK